MIFGECKECGRNSPLNDELKCNKCEDKLKRLVLDYIKNYETTIAFHSNPELIDKASGIHAKMYYDIFCQYLKTGIL